MTSRVETPTEGRPFTVDIPKEELTELRRRIATARWPTKELVKDASPLTDPTAHGGRAEDAFDRVLPSLPGAEEMRAAFRSLRNGGSS
jgi:hypothetical protein